MGDVVVHLHKRRWLVSSRIVKLVQPILGLANKLDCSFSHGDHVRVFRMLLLPLLSRPCNRPVKRGDLCLESLDLIINASNLVAELGDGGKQGVLLLLLLLFSGISLLELIHTPILLLLVVLLLLGED